jgi:hypothetical protein
VGRPPKPICMLRFEGSERQGAAFDLIAARVFAHSGWHAPWPGSGGRSRLVSRYRGSQRSRCTRLLWSWCLLSGKRAESIVRCRLPAVLTGRQPLGVQRDGRPGPERTCSHPVVVGLRLLQLTAVVTAILVPTAGIVVWLVEPGEYGSPFTGVWWAAATGKDGRLRRFRPRISGRTRNRSRAHVLRRPSRARP